MNTEKRRCRYCQVECTGFICRDCFKKQSGVRVSRIKRKKDPSLDMLIERNKA